MEGQILKVIDFKEIKKIAEKMKPAEWYDWVDNVLRKIYLTCHLKYTCHRKMVIIII